MNRNTVSSILSYSRTISVTATTRVLPLILIASFLLGMSPQFEAATVPVSLLSQQYSDSVGSVGYKERAERWKQRHAELALEVGYSLERLEGLTHGELVEASFVKVALGEVDVRIPIASLEDEAWQRRVLNCLAAICEVQVRWSEWIDDPEDEQLEERRDSLGELAKALRKTKDGTLRRLVPSPGMDFLGALKLDEELLASINVRPASSARTGEPSARATGATSEGSSARVLVADEFPPVRLVLLHNRVEFLDYTAAVGASYSHLRGIFWSTSPESWLAIEHDATRALALSFLEVGNPMGPGLPMDQRNALAMEEHVSQMAVRGLIDKRMGPGLEPMLAGGIATELIIDLFGEADTYTDGDNGAKSKNARSIFIPGGNSNGGILPTNAADSRWRINRGKGFFIAELKAAQKSGKKEAGRRAGKVSNFLLVSEDESQELVIRAPFLGQEAATTLPGEVFREDHLGFLRAYRTAFLHWLRTAAAGKGDQSQERFAEFLSAMAKSPSAGERNASGAPDMAAVLEELYGLPLSSGDTEAEDSLEAQFLNWLPKAKR